MTLFSGSDTSTVFATVMREPGPQEPRRNLIIKLLNTI
jgi:hypothetical protein